MDNNKNADLEEIFLEIGEFGPFQMVTVSLFTILNILTGAVFMMYMISSNTLDYRCKVPECEFDVNNRDLPYNQSWLDYTTPQLDEKFDNCHRYAPKNLTSFELLNGQCATNMFDSFQIIPCSEYVYTSDEQNIQTEFNIHCADTYKLAFVGSVSNIARFISLPITGMLCDRFGRLPGLVFGTQLGFVLATIKSFSTNYTMFIAFEFLENMATTFAFTGFFVFAIELMNAKYHVLLSTVYSIFYSFGGMVLGAVGYYVHNFRILMRIFYIPGLFIFVYYWMIPESVRWLLATGRIERAIQILKRIGKFNSRELSENTIKAIKLRYKQQSIGQNESSTANPSLFQLLWTVLKSKKLCLRFLLGCYQWITCAFCYYGLTQSAIQIPNTNHYISFIISMAIEIPCALLSQPLLSRIKRRPLMGGSYILMAISIILTPFIPETHSWAMLLCSLVSKAAVTVAFIVIYLYTIETWPTNIRSTITNTCSMIGRIGSMIAPFAVLLESEYGSISTLLFAATAIIAAITVLFSPETFNKKLPDTIQEAEDL